MIIVLMGYMGSGKSTIGRSLADVLNYNFIDLDTYIETRENDSITALFEKKGEIYFRKKEALYLNKLLNQDDNLVLALGGGTPCYSSNMESITKAKNVESFYLKLSINQLTNRLFAEKDTRPLISHIETKTELQEFIGKHLFERVNFYNKSHHTINVESKSVKETVEAILLNLI